MVEAKVGDQHEERELLERISRFAMHLQEADDLTETLQRVVDAADELFTESRGVGMMLISRGKIDTPAYSSEVARDIDYAQYETGQGPCLDSIHRERTIIDDLETDERWPLFAPRALPAGFRSVQAVPLRLRGAILDAFNLFMVQPGGIDRQAEAVVQAMADVATIGLLQQRELDRAHAVEGQLQRALQTRIGIEQAKGIISERMGIPMDAAFQRLRGYARNHNLKLHDVARDIVTGALNAADLP